MIGNTSPASLRGNCGNHLPRRKRRRGEHDPSARAAQASRTATRNGLLAELCRSTVAYLVPLPACRNGKAGVPCGPKYSHPGYMLGTRLTLSIPSRGVGRARSDTTVVFGILGILAHAQYLGWPLTELRARCISAGAKRSAL
jgi:hypothetical protein